jgi:uncharacterized protein YlxP (DUF503 family)
VHVLTLQLELRLPLADSLKAKRAIITPIVEGARRRYQVASSEVDHQDEWRRATLGFAAVSGSARHCDEVIDAVDRFVWSFPEIEVLDTTRRWLDPTLSSLTRTRG